jgi:ABC-2 type transport system permease protein
MSSQGNQISLGRRISWSLQRELWEHRSIYIAPLAAAVLFLFGFLIRMISPDKIHALSALNASQHLKETAQPYDFAAGLIMATTFVIAVIYSLDALYGERRDRSILFWKSLPVSDLSTVLSKASIPIVILPLLTFAITVVTQLLMLLLNSLAIVSSDLSIATLWTQTSLFHRWFILLYHLITIHALWYAPVFGWLLLVSAWSRRAPFLWAALPLIAIGYVEKIAFNTTHFVAMLQSRMNGGAEGDVFLPGTVSMNPLMHITPGNFMISPGLWVGLSLTALFLAAAVRLRRNRGPI